MGGFSHGFRMNKIREYRLAKGWNQPHLGSLVGLSVSTIDELLKN